MSEKIQAPKGTRDFYPEDMAVENRIFGVWRDTARLFGFEEYEGPVFEHLELFTRKSGAEIVKQLYHFKDKSDRDLALRPEITPTLARLMVQKGASLKKPVKWFSMPRCFRYERTQKGRLREFFQFNLDILGEAGVSADAELMAAAAHMMKSLGLTAEDFAIRVNSRKLVAGLLSSAGIAPAQLSTAYGLMDKRGKPEEYQAEKDRLLAEKELPAPDAMKIISVVEKILSYSRLEDIPESEAKGELLELFRLVEAYGMQDCVVFDMSVVRGLDYYTGIVWEVFDRAKSLRAIAGGGRYDNLIESFGGEKTPAAGFGVGDVVLQELLREKGLISPYRKQVKAYVVNFDKNSLAPAVAYASLLRSRGVSTEFSLKGQNVSKQMESSKNAAFAVFVGGEEWLAGKVKIRDMKSGQETVLSKEEAPGFILSS